MSVLHSNSAAVPYLNLAGGYKPKGPAVFETALMYQNRKKSKRAHLFLTIKSLAKYEMTLNETGVAVTFI